jgi:hypothetical protein
MRDKTIIWEDNWTSYELKARNVGELNPKAQIQLSMQEIPKNKDKRTKYFSINIPKEKITEFLEAIKEEK